MHGSHYLPRCRRGQHPHLRFFFFQAEDGIRDIGVTGVQTCALPIYPFFIEKIRHLVRLESRLRGSRRTRALLAEAKRSGFADESLAALTRSSEEGIRRSRPRAAYKMVDTCGGEFEARTPYFYSTYEATGETPRLRGRKVLIVGSGPVRIGQGVEFDYCCVQGIFALREDGVAAIIANNNPETVSTDFDLSTRLYFEPLLLEDVLNLIEA